MVDRPSFVLYFFEIYSLSPFFLTSSAAILLCFLGDPAKGAYESVLSNDASCWSSSLIFRVAFFSAKTGLDSFNCKLLVLSGESPSAYLANLENEGPQPSYSC